jgi:hypothetical protein
MTLGDRLAAIEPLSSDSQKRLQQELHAMFTRELGLPQRIFIGLVAVGGLASAALCGFLAITESNLPLVPRLGLGTGTLFGLAWAVVAGRVCWRGVMDLKIDNRRIAMMVWVFTVLMMMFFLMAGTSAKDRLLGVMMIVYGLTFFIGAAVHFITFRIEQAELSTRERLLELELRLAQLLEKQ